LSFAQRFLHSSHSSKLSGDGVVVVLMMSALIINSSATKYEASTAKKSS
jgi:hypothetical protein